MSCTRLVSLLATFLALSPAVTRGAEPWSQLKLGMTPEEATTKLGLPLLRTTGRGFEIWTYDNGAEMLMYGSLIAWTAPVSASLTERSADVWHKSGATVNYFPTFLSVLPNLPPKILNRPRPVESVPGQRNDTWLPLYVTRRR